MGTSSQRVVRHGTANQLEQNAGFGGVVPCAGGSANVHAAQGTCSESINSVSTLLILLEQCTSLSLSLRGPAAGLLVVRRSA